MALPLQNINLQFQEGDRVGVVGRNEVVNQLFVMSWLEFCPQRKRAGVREGRVVPLLGFGAALQPELSGYPNARLLARLLEPQRKMCPEFGRS